MARPIIPTLLYTVEEANAAIEPLLKQAELLKRQATSRPKDFHFLLDSYYRWTESVKANLYKTFADSKPLEDFTDSGGDYTRSLSATELRDQISRTFSVVVAIKQNLHLYPTPLIRMEQQERKARLQSIADRINNESEGPMPSVASKCSSFTDMTTLQSSMLRGSSSGLDLRP